MCCSCASVLGLCKPGVLGENDDLEGEDSHWLFFLELRLFNSESQGFEP